MKKSFLSRIAMLLIAVLLLGQQPVLVMGVKAETASAYEEHLGYRTLTTEGQRLLYVKMVECWKNYKRDVDLTLEEGKGVTSEDIMRANAAIKNDFPEFFFIHSVGDLQSLRNGYYICLVYQSPWGSLNDAEQRKNLTEAEAIVARKVEEILTSVPANVVTDYDKALWVHDYLVDNVDYQASKHDQSVYGALVEGECVCAGYANAYTLLLRKLGVKTYGVSGLAGEKREPHRWNMSLIDGECVYTDVTWDDGAGDNSFQFSWDNGDIRVEESEKNKYRYFNLSGAEMAKAHDAYDWYDAILPACSHEGHGYKDLHPKHKIEVVAEKPVGCEEVGMKAHYRCTDCGLLFLDPDGVTAVENDVLIVPANGHTVKWQYDTEGHWQVCTVCNERMGNMPTGHCDENKDEYCDVCGYKGSLEKEPEAVLPEGTEPEVAVPEVTEPEKETETVVPENTDPQQTVPESSQFLSGAEILELVVSAVISAMIALVVYYVC